MHVYGTDKRLFLNSTLGCRSKCSYCYLPSLDYQIDAPSLVTVPSEEIIQTVASRADYIPGKHGTIISLGCYSECWDESVRSLTIELIEHFLRSGNPVQFATKREVKYEDLEEIRNYISWYGQLSIFVSSTTLTHWNKIEKNTDSPIMRFNNFKLTKKLGIPVYLYIKPVLESITIKDLDNYLNLIEERDISGVVVGRKFVKDSQKNTNDYAPISNKALKYSNTNKEVNLIYNTFNKKLPTFTESVQAIEFWRNHVEK
ncbi:radical SAM protein [Vibrio parahaemolyticus]|uniref:radical SAM protein n=1 Tax=Vibrio TaxID=662 RepID=UPI001BD5AF26|nr:radical SAM protein [Vibrio sp. YT-18]EGR0771080.1 radical SAM protein [Vibrio parahaemolyticus]EJS0325238.1 radical SAM protein [Vibrio alginolyticus]EGR0840730.1 radical SAM protein [Vibrio parahaemolyticus]EJL7426821.1 radical SAM protein [Vibrio parahaemolyticus]ELA7073554.1 radical SAM protein [Vibrio parahaemolyticus]